MRKDLKLDVSQKRRSPMTASRRRNQNRTAVDHRTGGSRKVRKEVREYERSSVEYPSTLRSAAGLCDFKYPANKQAPIVIRFFRFTGYTSRMLA